MQAIAVAAAFHDAPSLLIHDFHFALGIHDIFLVDVKQGVGLEQLCDGVHTLRLHAVVLQQFVFLGDFLFLAQRLVGYGRQLRGDVGQDEELWVVGALCEHIDTLVGQLNGVVLLLNDEV